VRPFVPPIAALLAVLAVGCTGRVRCGPPCAPDSPAPSCAPVPAPPPDPDAASLPAEVLAVASPRPWKVIVVHHSADAVGGAARIDAAHRARGWDGVGYDFVVGNGSDTPDGAIETTFRWREQRDGAHAKGWNDVAIGICLVGNFEETDPTPRQRETLVTLVRHLRRRFSIPGERVIGHGAVGATQCPGRRLPLKEIVAETDPAPDVPAAPPRGAGP
jgi:hypothetical protein